MNNSSLEQVDQAMRQRFRLFGVISLVTLAITVGASEEFKWEVQAVGGAESPAGIPALFTDPEVPDGMVLAYRSRLDEKEPFVHVVYTVAKAPGQDGPVYLVSSEAGDGNVVTMRLRAADLRPLYVEKKNSRNQVVQINEYGPEKVRMTLPQKGVTRTFPNAPDLYDQESLFFVFLGFPFEEAGRRLSFQLFMGENGIHRVSLQVVAEEDVQVLAGDFAAYKLEMVPEGLVGFIGARFKSYFWYTRGPGHHGFVKYAFPAFDQISESTDIPVWAQDQPQKR